VKLSVSLDTVCPASNRDSGRYPELVSSPRIQSNRDVARSALRAELVRVTVEQFLESGFDEVTVSDLAEAAGVSRSTFLRYVGSKEDAVLGLFDVQGQELAAALEARPAAERPWAALRRTLGPLTGKSRTDPARAFEVARLINQTPSLLAGLMQRQRVVRQQLVPVLIARGQPRLSAVQASVLASAALDCINIANELWVASGGTLRFDELVDDAFDTFEDQGSG
jgi:AcrR family transcriptional regulator